MRILFTTFPARGHFHPLAPLALAAQSAGHDVRVASGPDLADWAQQCGFDAEAIGPSQAALLADARGRYSDEDYPAHLFTDLWVLPALRGLLDLARRWRPDLVVQEEEEYAAPLFGRLLGIPVVTHSWHAPARPEQGRVEAAALLGPVWSWAGLSEPVLLAGALYLDACPPPLQNLDVRGIEHVRQVRPVSYDGFSGETPMWSGTLGSPAAYLTLGTVPVFSTAERLRQLVEALAPVLSSLVVTTGPNPVEALGVLPANVHAEQYLPQSAVLAQIDLVVSQAGAGGTLGAIEHGLPHLMLPLRAQSQIATAAAIDALGAGRCVAGDWDAVDLATIAADLIADASYRQAALRIRDDLQNLPSPADVLAVLEELVEGEDSG